MLISKKPLYVAIASALVTAPAVHAKDIADVITITGQSAAVDAQVGADDLSRVQAQNLADIFRQEPSVQVGGGGTNTAQKIYVRGLEDTQLNITIDGAFQSGTMFHHQGRLQIEPELLKQVEIEAGAGAATSGPGALGGAIRFTTVDPQDMIKEGKNFGGLVKASYGDNADYIKLHTTVAGKLSDQLSVMGSITQADADNYQDGDGNEIDHTPVDQMDGLFKVFVQPADGHELRFSHNVTTDEGRRAFRVNQNVRSGNEDTPLDLERQTTTFGYNYNPADEMVDVEATLYRNNTQMEQSPPGRYAGRFGVATPEVLTYGLDLRNTSILGKNSLTYGIDYRNEEGSNTRTGSSAPAWSGTRTDKSELVGLYVQNNYRVNDSWLLSAGLRYDHSEFDSWDNVSVSHDEFSPNASATYFFNDQWSVRAGYAQAHRPPSIREAFLIGDRAFEADIQSEKAENLELAVNYDNGALHVAAEVYKQDITDPHNIWGYGHNDFGGLVEDIEINGYSLQVGYQWDQLAMNFSVSESDPEQGGEALYDAHPWGTSVGRTWTASLDYDMPEHNLTMGWFSRVVEDLEDVPAGAAEKEGFDLHDIYAQWKPAQVEDLTVTFSINNLFDERYYEHTTQSIGRGALVGNYEQGRDVRLSVAYRF